MRTHDAAADARLYYRQPHSLSTLSATENGVVVQQLLDDLIGRSLDPAQPMLIDLDGGKALSKAVHKTIGDASPVKRCQLHKRRNVKALLPKVNRAAPIRGSRRPMP